MSWIWKEMQVDYVGCNQGNGEGTLYLSFANTLFPISSLTSLRTSQTAFPLSPHSPLLTSARPPPQISSQPFFFIKLSTLNTDAPSPPIPQQTSAPLEPPREPTSCLLLNPVKALLEGSQCTISLAPTLFFLPRWPAFFISSMGSSAPTEIFTWAFLGAIIDLLLFPHSLQ